MPDVYRFCGFDLMIAERLVGALALVAGELDEAERWLTEADRVAREAPTAWTSRTSTTGSRACCSPETAQDGDEAMRRAGAARDEFARRSPPFLSQAEALIAAGG